ncbi:hypothetical protein GIB67_008373 [Kingdonia uniflora]|uniref:Knr4/Smi1-like domain-containing protein n=1 Tax=Kingdonia uniflora TaxID=39325 RepID=A0A7J7N5B7_9MAGN|nr:hypothetical protein GIB67_008373 [Kingdonia uniflora]
MALEEMGELVLHEIGSKLGSKDAAVLGCVNKRLRVSASDESLWINFCSQELNLSVPEDHLGNPTPSFKVAYQKWREAFNMYPWPLVQRVNKCWGSLKSWTATNFPEALTTLRKGVSEAEIKEVEEKLGVKLPLPTKVLYRFCDGQAITGRDSRSALGLIGGYSFYDHLVNVYLLPLSEVITRTKDFVRHLGFSSRNKYIVVAVSSTYREKLFFLNCMNGQLYVGTRNLSSDGEMIPCVSFPLISSVHDTKSCEQQDAMLLWLEEHGRRLNNGIIGLRVEGKHRSINLFPETSPLCSIAITNGIKVTTVHFSI